MSRPDDPRVVAALSELAAWSDALPPYDVGAGASRHAELLARGATPSFTIAATRSTWRAWAIVAGIATVALAIGLVATRDANAPASSPEPAAPQVASVGPTERHIDRAPTNLERAPTNLDRPATALRDADATVLHVDGDGIDATAPRVDEPKAERSASSASRTTTGTASHGPARTPDRTETTSGDDVLERELAIVRRMRAQLTGDPAAVLALARTADRDIGPGVFAEERAALRVFALVALDDPRAASAATTFLREHGEGPFAAKVRAAITPPG